MSVALGFPITNTTDLRFRSFSSVHTPYTNDSHEELSNDETATENVRRSKSGTSATTMVDAGLFSFLSAIFSSVTVGNKSL